MALDPVDSSEQGGDNDGLDHEALAPTQPTTTVPPAQAAHGTHLEVDVRPFTHTNPEFIDQTVVSGWHRFCARQ
jgi:hypothetical protein